MAPNASIPSLRSQHDATLDELAQYKLLVENIEDYAIFMMDANGYIKTWNKGAQKIKGYSGEEIINRHFSNFYLPHDKAAKKPERELELARKYGRVEDEDWRVKKDGSKFWANVVITALFSPAGKLIGFAKVTRDLTERKQHEDYLRNANNLLRHQQQELESLNASKDEFVSLASHQLRTPATAIKQLLGLLIEGFSGTLTPQQFAIVKKAYQSNERQIATVNSLLKVAQLDAGKVVFVQIPTDIRKLLRGVVDDYKDRCTKQDQTISLKIDKDLPKYVPLDNDHIRMAIENIVDNACKYTPEGGQIKLSASKSKEKLKIIIQDTGVGIAQADMSKLFIRFSRIPNNLSTYAGGSGLGLYWANKVIALHNGSIEVDSVINKGTAFSIYLPLGGKHA